MNKQTIITILFALIVVTATAQTSFDTRKGCLNVVDVSSAQGVGEYGDGGVSANYMHETFINERFSIGAGIGYSYHDKYRFSAIPVYISTHYFFLDKRFSPFVNLRLGGFGMFGEKRVNTNQKYSISSKKPELNLFVSPSIGVKVHLAPNIGVMASISDEAYLANAFDTNKNNYGNKLINSLGFNLGVCFQIKGW